MAKIQCTFLYIALCNCIINICFLSIIVNYDWVFILPKGLRYCRGGSTMKYRISRIF